MKLLAVVIFISLIASESLASRCDKELEGITTFAKRESQELQTRLTKVKSGIERLPRRERVRANVLWFEAESSRGELDKTLKNLASMKTMPCAQINEDIRARLFRAQEFAFQVVFRYDDRLSTF